METRKILVILFLALGLTVWAGQVSEAEPMGTTFTYQGRLIDANEGAEGLCDFQFKLYDGPNAFTGGARDSRVHTFPEQGRLYVCPIDTKEERQK